MRKKQSGYGLIETIAGLGLAGLLTLGITTFTIQTITEGARANNRMQAVMQVENAGYWVTRDVQMSANLTLGDDAGFPFQLFWEDIDNNEYQVTYDISDNTIKRYFIQNDEEAVQTLIANNINSTPSLTNISFVDGLLVFVVTSTSADFDVGETYQIKKRLDLE
jgi:type II secretory pathway pseudopilin PulG